MKSLMNSLLADESSKIASMILDFKFEELITGSDADELETIREGFSALERTRFR